VKKVLLILLLLLIIAIPAMAQEKAGASDTTPMIEVDGGDVKAAPMEKPADVKVVVPAEQPEKATEVPASAKSSPATEEKETTPDLMKELPVPDVDKITDLAEKETEEAGWGTYGSVFVLLLAAIMALLRIKKKKQTDDKKPA